MHCQLIDSTADLTAYIFPGFASHEAAFEAVSSHVKRIGMQSIDGDGIYILRRQTLPIVSSINGFPETGTSGIGNIRICRMI